MKFALNGFTAYGERDGLRQVGTVFDDRAGNLCYRGAVLGDTRASVFEGARLDLVSTAQPAYYERIGCFDGQHFNGFQPAAMKSLYWGWVSEQIILQTRCGEWWIGTGVGLYRFPPADRLDALRTSPTACASTRRTTAWPRRRCSGSSRTRAATCGSRRLAPIRMALRDGSTPARRVHDLAGLPGLPSLKSTPAALVRRRRGSGHVWMGFDGKLARYQDGAFELVHVERRTAAREHTNIYLDHAGRLWLASGRSGLVRVDDVEGRAPTFTALRRTQGLSSNTTASIAEDPSGRIYVGGGHGLDRLDPTTGHVKHFTTADGLLPGSFRAAFRDRDGVLWFGMTSGIVRLCASGGRDRRSRRPC